MNNLQSDDPYSAGDKYSVLVVDDNPTNLSVVFDYLEAHGYVVLVAQDGESGLQKARYALPDIILLDIMMPGLDGFETCRLLKADELTQDIPVIFMTALAGIEDKVKGFAVGAVDYVTKPLHQDEVYARVKTHLQLRALTRELQEANAALAALNADKDKFFSIVAHDLKGPFAPLLLRAQMLAEHIDRLKPEKIRRMSEDIFFSARQISDLLENLLQWSRLQMGRVSYEPQDLALTELVARNLRLLRDNATAKGVLMDNLVGNGLSVYADMNMLDTVLRNLVSNAVKFTSPGGEVVVAAEHDEQQGRVQVTVRDTGVGMSSEDLARLFKIGVHPTTVGTGDEKGTGLGLILCQEMVQRNGGKIHVESEPGQGTAVYFTVPEAR